MIFSKTKKSKPTPKKKPTVKPPRVDTPDSQTKQTIPFTDTIYTLIKRRGIYTHIEHTQPIRPNIFSPRSVLYWFNHASKAKRRLYVILHKQNGYIELFYAYYQGNIFLHDQKMYIVDEDRLRWNDSTKTFVGEYYENMSLPIQLQKEKDTVTKQVREMVRDTQVEMNVNPGVLYQTVKTEVIQKVMKGEEIESVLRTVISRLTWVLLGVALIIVAIIGRFI